MASAVPPRLHMIFFGVRASLSLPVFLACIATAQVAAGQGFFAREVAAEANANTQYVIEAVQISGENGLKLSRSLQAAFQQMIGSHFDPSQLDEVAHQMRKELHLKSVTPHLLRGSQPDTVCVNFEVHRRAVVFDITLPKFLYHSRQGWSAEGNASTTVARDNRFSFGLVSDGDALTERFAGLAAVYENTHIGTDRVHLGFEFDDLHEQWNNDTLMAIGHDPHAPQIYRARRNFQPMLTILVARPVTFQAGVSFEQMQMEPSSFSPSPASNTDSANSVFAAVHFHRQFEETNQTSDVSADYDIRSGGRALHSDYAYTRHHWDVAYTVSRGNQTFLDEFTGGFISGDAPFFERFVVGTSSLLRGWNRFEIDPLGGTRLVHNSVTYRYRFPKVTGQVFYDAGALWHGDEQARLRHSAGVGMMKSIFTLAVAFPLRDGHMDPVFMVGMNY